MRAREALRSTSPSGRPLSGLMFSLATSYDFPSSTVRLGSATHTHPLKLFLKPASCSRPSSASVACAGLALHPPARGAAHAGGCPGLAGPPKRRRGSCRQLSQTSSPRHAPPCRSSLSQAWGAPSVGGGGHAAGPAGPVCGSSSPLPVGSSSRPLFSSTSEAFRSDLGPRQLFLACGLGL